MITPKVCDWKQQFFEVHKIGVEPSMTRPPWKKFKPVEIKASGSQESKRTSS